MCRRGLVQQYFAGESSCAELHWAVGAIIAGICYQFIGAAAYLLAAILLGFRGAKLFYPGLRVAPRLAWIVLFIISGACLLHVQPYHLRGWHAAFNIQGRAVGSDTLSQMNTVGCSGTRLAHSVRFSCPRNLRDHTDFGDWPASRFILFAKPSPSCDA
jgi:amino acid transporter